MAVGGYQQREFGPGAALGTAVEYRTSRVVGLAVQLDGLMLSDGAEPHDPEHANNNGASLAALLAGANLRSESGFWLNLAGGFGFTGGLFRPATSVSVGFEAAHELPTRVGFGPMLKWVHLFQPDSGVRPEDANLVIAGLQVAFGGSMVGRGADNGTERQ